MKNLFKIALAIYFIFSINALRAYNDSIINKEGYDIVNLLLIKEKVECLEIKAIPFLLEKQIKRLDIDRMSDFFLKMDSTIFNDHFKVNDIEYMQRQLRENKNFRWDRKLIHEKILIGKRRDLIGEDFKTIALKSFPLLNIKMDKALVYLVFRYGGSSWSAFYMLTKDNGLWDVVLIFPVYNAS